tara:strand:- start:1326 stop:1979 length:654 start_codon:yes stop_codon:yes gene_type:complete
MDIKKADVKTSPDFVTLGLEKMKNTVIQTFKGSNIYLIIFLIILFLGIGFYVYTTYMSPMFENDYVANNENKTVSEQSEEKIEYDKSKQSQDSCDVKADDIGGKRKPMIMYLIYTSWCPYSQKAKKEWDKLKEYYNSKMQGKYVIDFKEIDGDNKSEIKNFTKNILNDGKDKSDSINWKEIEGYPTIYLKKENTIYEYEATPKKDTLIEFITQVDLA